jgi:hypothetical protein
VRLPASRWRDSDGLASGTITGPAPRPETVLGGEELRMTQVAYSLVIAFGGFVGRSSIMRNKLVAYIP